jgi:methionine-rich copper-binding protein CopC
LFWFKNIYILVRRYFTHNNIGASVMKKRTTITLVSIALLLIPFVFAQAVIVDTSGHEATISPLGEAAFTITVSNNQPEGNLYVLELSDVAWSLRTRHAPDLTTGIALAGYESTNTTVYIKPDPSITAGTYYVELRIRSRDTGKVMRELFSIKIDPKLVDYSITVPVEVLEPTSIDPQKTNSVKAVIKNPYSVHLTNISVEATSKFLNKKTTVDIPPRSQKVIDFALNLDESTPKQEDRLSIVVKQNNKEIGSAQATLYIKEFRLPYQTEIVVANKFLYTLKQITFTNTEGARKTQDASIEKPQTYAMVYSTPRSKTETFSNQDFLVWTGVALNPGESYVVTVVEDFRPFVAFIVIIIIGIICYYQFRSPVIVKKKAYAIHKKDTGNNELKVVLYVKNRSNSTLEKVRVLDRLPIIHRVEEDFGPGTPEPKYRKHGTEGTILDWDIVLAPQEERIFTYKVKSALPIVGEYVLKPCVVQYGHNEKRTTSAPYRLQID